MSIDIPSLLSLRKKMEKYGPGSFAGCPELQGSQLLWTHEAVALDISVFCAVPTVPIESEACSWTAKSADYRALQELVPNSAMAGRNGP